MSRSKGLDNAIQWVDVLLKHKIIKAKRDSAENALWAYMKLFGVYVFDGTKPGSSPDNALPTKASIEKVFPSSKAEETRKQVQQNIIDDQNEQNSLLQKRDPLVVKDKNAPYPDEEVSDKDIPEITARK